MQVCEVHLHTLALDRSASFDEIREAYQDLVVVWHPDRFMGNPRLYKRLRKN
ncbi:MAG: J domain-containing protein [Acaryochloridaceae cyanobacterium CSU_5_19]|nr:J domain-containing protein [Acaryochloridaceae cyanobacterium CSU_5_19]